MGGPELDTLIQLFARVPGLGPRSARRAVLKLLQNPAGRMLPLAQALVEAARAVRNCSLCGNMDSRDPCTICTDDRRDHSVICVVETVGDLWALERAHVHNGLYHVLGGALSALGGTGPDDLNLAPLLERVAAGAAPDSVAAGAAPDSVAAGAAPDGVAAGAAPDSGAGAPAPNRNVQEVILALSATVDGAATAHYLTDRLASSFVRVTRVAQGVPIGGALDVLDDGTLATALRARR